MQTVLMFAHEEQGIGRAVLSQNGPPGKERFEERGGFLTQRDLEDEEREQGQGEGSMFH